MSLLTIVQQTKAFCNSDLAVYDFVQTVVALSLSRLSVLMACWTNGRSRCLLKSGSNPLELHRAQTSLAYIYQVLDTKSWIPSLGYQVLDKSHNFAMHKNLNSLSVQQMPETRDQV